MAVFKCFLQADGITTATFLTLPSYRANCGGLRGTGALVVTIRFQPLDYHLGVSENRVYSQ